MSAVQCDVPDEVNRAFNVAYAGHDKNAIITELMREATERADRADRARRAPAAAA